MTGRWARRTVELADFIKSGFFDVGVLDVRFDELVIAWRAFKTCSLAEAASHIERHVAAAGDNLRERGWVITGVTEAFFSDYGSVIPKTDDDLRRCIPGLAGDAPTAGWHVRDSDNTELAIMAYFRDLNAGNGKVIKNTRRMADAVVAGEADPDAVASRNVEAHLPSTMAQMRRVTKATEPPKALTS